MNHRTRLLPVLLLCAAPLAAQEAGLGAQIHVFKPVGTFADRDHLDGRTGLGLGVQVPIDFGAGHVLRPRLDYLAGKRDNAGTRYDTRSWVLMADYVYHVAQEKEGAYVFGGLGLHSSRISASRTWGLAAAETRATTTGLAYALGLGYAFNRNLAVEAKFQGLDMGRMAFRQGFPADAGYFANSVVGTVSFTF
jgi:opacity protein-like surface antigen